MILIADAGATSIDWRYIDEGGNIHQAQTSGFNAYQHDENSLRESVKQLLVQLRLSAIQECHFYGAGVSSLENRNKTALVLEEMVHPIKLFVEHDLLAAARSLLGDQEGIACILGTGTNSCHYDGEKILSVVPSLGYALGDEGSGASLGKRLLVSYLRNEMPEKIKTAFSSMFTVNETQVLHNIYQGDSPSRYLASFSTFLQDHQKNPFIYELIRKEFKRFFEDILLKYSSARDVPVNFCGSIAYFYNNILRQVANEFDIHIKHIVQSPIAGLSLFHQKKFQ